MGLWNREAAAVDPEGKAVYMTEDHPEGLLYRYTPTDYPDLSAGALARRQGRGRRRRHLGRGRRPSAAETPTNQQVEGATVFVGGEGIWYHDGTIYFTSKGDNSVHAIDLAEQQLRAAVAQRPGGRRRRGRRAVRRRQHHGRPRHRRPVRGRGRREHGGGDHHPRRRRRPVRPAHRGAARGRRSPARASRPTAPGSTSPASGARRPSRSPRSSRRPRSTRRSPASPTR